MDSTEAAHVAQLASPSYRLAALDQDFLLGPSMRGVRFLLEFAKVDEALRAWGVRSTMVLFGWGGGGRGRPPAAPSESAAPPPASTSACRMSSSPTPTPRPS